MHAKQEKCNHETRCASVFSCTDSAIQFFPLYIFYFFKVLYKKGKCTENFEKISRCFHHAIIFGYSPFYTKDFCNIHQSTCRIVYVLASNRHYLAGRSRKQSTLSSSSRKQSTPSNNSRKQRHYLAVLASNRHLLTILASNRHLLTFSQAIDII